MKYLAAFCRTLFLFSAAAVQLAAQDPHYEGALKAKPAVELKIWNGTAPGEVAGADNKEKAVPGKEKMPRIMVNDVTVPMLSVFQPETSKTNGTCIVIFPGGGYGGLAYSHEGTEIAHYFNSLGITAVVVKYRVPRKKNLPKHFAPLQDAQRAMRLVRQNAETWKIDPKKIGALGFSAGAHLTLMLATHYDENVYELQDEADKLSARPDFACPIYLAYALGEKYDKNNVNAPLDKEIIVTKDTPPMFLSVCDDDPVNPMGSGQLYTELRKNKIPCELHVFVKGGHGYGIRNDRGPAAGWNVLCEQWLKQIGMIP